MKMTAKEMKQIIQDCGMTCQSSHYGFGELKENLQERIDFALESGQTQMILSSFWIPEKAGMDDWLKAADELNEIGLKVKKAGLVAGYHNHHMEFDKIDGKLIYDALLERLDPGMVKMQFQVAVVNIGYKASDYFRKYPGRFISAHLSDWSEEKQDQVPIGHGVVDWKEFFSLAETAGLKNTYVEMDEVTFKESAEFLKNM
jgi:sugar phosphate isomerase/epimerase